MLFPFTYCTYVIGSCSRVERLKDLWKGNKSCDESFGLTKGLDSIYMLYWGATPKFILYVPERRTPIITTSTPLNKQTTTHGLEATPRT